MKIVYYKLPSNPEHVVVSESMKMFDESEVALLFETSDYSFPYRYKISCENGFIRVKEVDEEEELYLTVESEDDFECVIPHDSEENAMIQGKLIHKSLVELEKFYERMES